MSKTGAVQTGQARTGGELQTTVSPKTGQARTGQEPTGGTEIGSVQLPSRTIEVQREPPSATGVGAVTATASARNIELSRITPTTTGVGTVTVATALRSLELSRFSPTIEPTVLSVTLPARQLELIGPTAIGDGQTGEYLTGEQKTGGSTDQTEFVPTITGVGGAPVLTPLRSLELSRVDPTVTGAGTGTATTPLRTLELSRFAPSLLTVVTVPTRELELSRDAPLVGSTEWIIDNQTIGEITAERRTPTRLTLTTRVQTETLDAAVRPLKSDQGKVDLLTTDDGGFVAVDRANGGNTFSVIPPIQRRPLRRSNEFHVERYDEELVSEEVTEWDVEIELTDGENRTDTPSISQSPDADEWGFTTRFGTIVPQSISAEFAGTGQDGVRRYEVVGTFTFDQCHVFEAALNRLNATRTQKVVDESNQILDETDDGAASVTIDAPDGQDTISDGSYVVTEWESERLNDAFQSVEFVIAEQ